MQDGEWAKPDPAFEGKIVVDQGGKFCGYCCESCANESTKYSFANPSARKTRTVVGALAEEGAGYSLLLFELSNNTEQVPLSYEIHDVSKANCIWSAKDPYGGFVPQGNARIALEELPCSNGAADRIMARFYEVDKSIGDNEALICEVDSWQKKTMVLWG